MSIESRRARREERYSFKHFVPANIEEAKYHEALKRVKRIKGFYVHLMVYIVVNAGILVASYNNRDVNENFWMWQTFNTVFFWGIGIVAHGLSVFMPGFLLGKDWEERKINQLMEKEKNNKWE